MEALLAATPVLTVRVASVSDMDNNVYLLTSSVTGHQLLIDAADDPVAIGRLLGLAASDAPGPPRLSLIVTTHSHRDHIRALAPLVQATGAAALAGKDDVAAIENQTGISIARGLEHGDIVGVPGLTLKVIGLRGHTPGSIALAYQEDGQPAHLFTGDSLFPGGVGNTDRDPGRFNRLMADVTERVFDLYPDDAIVHPGHGAPTTLGAERPHLDEWRERGW
ncbi:MAG: MBL fold metallo-hydrolase [Bifidobacteriaceae bacterium]|jgi:glyoxylase-like metal-dependent hydrolase (beta-lactamase superfamily II)|nr:MBL fold metallo-hydrolase [Bifidobacteriaceae bacterium]